MNEVMESRAEVYKREFMLNAEHFEKNFYDPQFLSALHNIYCDYLDSKYPMKNNDGEMVSVSKGIENRMRKPENAEISNSLELNNWVDDDFLSKVDDLNEKERSEVQDAFYFFIDLFIVGQIFENWSSKNKKEKLEALEKVEIANEVIDKYLVLNKKISKGPYSLVEILKRATDEGIKKIIELTPKEPNKVANFIAEHQQQHYNQNYYLQIMTNDKDVDIDKKKQRQSFVARQDTKKSLIIRILHYIKDNYLKLMAGFILGAGIVVGVGFAWPVIVPSFMVAVMGMIASLAVMGVLGGILGTGFTAVLHQAVLKCHSLFKRCFKQTKNDFKPETKKITKSISTKELNKFLKTDKENDNDAIVKLTTLLCRHLKLELKLEQINSLPSISLKKLLIQAIRMQPQEKLSNIYINLKTQNDSMARFFVEFLGEIPNSTLLKMYQILSHNNPIYANKFRDDVTLFLSSNDQLEKSNDFLEKLSQSLNTEKPNEVYTDAVNQEDNLEDSKVIHTI